MISLNTEIESIRTESEDDYMVNLISPTEVTPTPTKLHIKFGNTKYWVTVDSGSSNSLVTERMALEIENRDKNSWWSCRTNPTNLRSFTNTPIRNVGTLYSDIECNGWNTGRADLIVVANNHRAITGRDLFQGLGYQVNQQSPPRTKDDNIMGEDELISAERWEQEDLNSDEEVRTSKERMLTAAYNDTGEIPRTFRMTPHSILEPVAESSKVVQLARKTIASTRSKKQTKACMKQYQKVQH